jgi:hypothetical protein
MSSASRRTQLHRGVGSLHLCVSLRSSDTMTPSSTSSPRGASGGGGGGATNCGGGGGSCTRFKNDGSMEVAAAGTYRDTTSCEA